MSLIIAGKEMPNPLVLAPMAGVTDLPYRLLCKEQGVGLVYTEMVSAKGMHYDDAKSFQLAETVEGERPATVQIFGSDPVILAGMAAKVSENPRVDFIDINMGCPAPKIVKNGDGSALMRKPELIRQIVTEVVKASARPVTVKIRKGWDEHSVNAVEVAKIIEDCGAAALAVHGRTREQQYSGRADWDIIRQVKAAVSIPVIGNGDVVQPGDALRMLTETGCDGVMIGRGAQGNPWLFARCLHALQTGEILPEPGPEVRIAMILRHMGMLCDRLGEHTGVREMRKHIAWYLRGIRHAAVMRDYIFRMHTRDEIEAYLTDWRSVVDRTSS